MTMQGLLEKRNAIYGICALWIVLFHLSRKIGMPFYIPVVTEIISIGNMAVDVFLFLSGLCLSISADRNKYTETGWTNFFRKRLIRVLVPYFLIGIPYYFWKHAIQHHSGLKKTVLDFLYDFSSVTFWRDGTQTTWFVYAIVILYCLFPIFYCFAIRNRRRPQKITACVLLLCCFAYVASVTPILKNSAIAWARVPIFLIGVYAGVHMEKLDLSTLKQPYRKNVIVISMILLLCLGYIAALDERKIIAIKTKWRWLLYIPMTMALVLCLMAIGDKWKAKPNGVLTPVGALSLEIYLVHITLLHPLRQYGFTKKPWGYSLYLLPVISVLLAYVVDQIGKLVLKKGTKV